MIMLIENIKKNKNKNRVMVAKEEEEEEGKQHLTRVLANSGSMSEAITSTVGCWSGAIGGLSGMWRICHVSIF